VVIVKFLYLQHSNKKYLLQNPLIKRCLSGLLLLLFTFSITPRQLLHDAFANHKDTAVKASAARTPLLSNAGFNCACDNLVAESPFTEAAIAVDIIPPMAFAVQPAVPVPGIHFIPIVFSGLRGPPATFEA
jgi:hypothetical protein